MVATFPPSLHDLGIVAGEDWDTIGGLLYSLLGHVPTEGESADVDGHRLVAERVQGRRIGRVRISAMPSGALSRDQADDDSDRSDPRSENGTR